MDNKKYPFKVGANLTVKEFGTHLALANALGYSDLRNISPWANGIRPFTPEHCSTIERLSDGRVPRQILRPHDFWKIWPDLAHLAPATQPAPQAVITTKTPRHNPLTPLTDEFKDLDRREKLGAAGIGI